MAKDSLQNNLLAAGCCLLWATPFAFVKITLEYQSPLTVAGLRFLLAGLIQIPLCKSLLSPFRLLRDQPRPVILVSLFQTILLYAGFFIAMDLVRAAQAAIVIGAGPLIAALGAHFAMKDDRLSRWKVHRNSGSRPASTDRCSGWRSFQPPPSASGFTCSAASKFQNSTSGNS